MMILFPSANHIFERVIPGGGVHCHWKEPSLATVQERLADVQRASYTWTVVNYYPLWVMYLSTKTIYIYNPQCLCTQVWET